MPVPKGTKKDAETIARLKDEYVAYFADAPVQKYAAMYIGRDEETVILWRQQDPDFAGRVNQAQAKWARKRFLQSKAEFQLERLDRQLFGANLDITTKGEKLPTPILGGITTQDVPSDDGDQEAPQA